jgi:sarcosine oxidase
VSGGDGREVEYVVVGLGALGSATCYELARRGHQVLGLERFDLGHARGASHDTSRILRHSYHTPAYVRLTVDAYADWARLERASGRRLVTRTGGLDLFPPGAAIDPATYTSSLDEVGVPYRVLDVAEVRGRWPQFRLPSGTLALHQADTGVVHASATTSLLRRLAEAHGAVLRDRAAVTLVRERRGAVEIRVAHRGWLRCRRLVVTADAWTNQVLAGVGRRIPLEVTLEQVSYFVPDRAGDFAPGRFPVWIWMDDPSYYGFPCYGAPTVKAAQDCGGPAVDPDDRPGGAVGEVDGEMHRRLEDHLRRTLPGVGPAVRSLRCLYTLTPDRDLVLSAVPGHEDVVVGLGAAHGFKFTPTLGRLLADLAVAGETATDLSAFRMDRPALTVPGVPTRWLV